MASTRSDPALDDAVLLGLAAGLRSASAPAALALGGRFGPGRPRRLAPAFALGEIVADKLPFVPSRTSAGPLGGRIASGALSGGARGGSRAAVAAAALAVVAAYGGQHTRQWLGRHTDRSDWQLALMEDALAYALAFAGARRAGAI